MPLKKTCVPNKPYFLTQKILERERARFAMGLKISEFLVLTLEFNTTIVSFDCGLDKVQQTDSHGEKTRRQEDIKGIILKRHFCGLTHREQDLIISATALSSSPGTEFNWRCGFTLPDYTRSAKEFLQLLLSFVKPGRYYGIYNLLITTQNYGH